MNVCPQGACRQGQALMSPHVSRKASGREGTRRGCDLRHSIQRTERRPVWEGQEDLSGEELLELNSEGRRRLWCKERKKEGARQRKLHTQRHGNGTPDSQRQGKGCGTERGVSDQSEEALKTQRNGAGYRSNSIALNSITVKTLIYFFLNMKIFKPTLKAYLSQKLFHATKCQYNQRMKGNPLKGSF